VWVRRSPPRSGWGRANVGSWVTISKSSKHVLPTGPGANPRLAAALEVQLWILTRS
jgi:hypothetical protein